MKWTTSQMQNLQSYEEIENLNRPTTNKKIEKNYCNCERLKNKKGRFVII